MAGLGTDPDFNANASPHLQTDAEDGSPSGVGGGRQEGHPFELARSSLEIPDRRLRFELKELGLVASGAIPGALLRWQLVEWLGPQIGFHSGANLIVNLIGCWLLGVLSGPIPHRTTLLLALGIGFCGSLTTFSGWILDLASLQGRGQGLGALALLVSSLGLGLLAALGGKAMSRRLFRARQHHPQPRH